MIKNNSTSKELNDIAQRSASAVIAEFAKEVKASFNEVDEVFGNEIYNTMIDVVNDYQTNMNSSSSSSDSFNINDYKKDENDNDEFDEAEIEEIDKLSMKQNKKYQKI